MTLNKPSIRVPASGARRTCRVRTQYNSLKEGDGETCREACRAQDHGLARKINRWHPGRLVRRFVWRTTRCGAKGRRYEDVTSSARSTSIPRENVAHRQIHLSERRPRRAVGGPSTYDRPTDFFIIAHDPWLTYYYSSEGRFDDDVVKVVSMRGREWLT